MQVLLKTFSALQLYSPNNQIYLQAIDNMRGAFKLVWQQFDELEFEVAETTLTWDDKVVLTQEDKVDSIPWTLFKDGVRSFSMSPSIEEREMLAFLHLLKDARALASDDPDDLLTLLWEQDFQFLRYRFVELGFNDVPRIDRDALAGGGEGGGRAAAPSPEETRQRLESEVASSDETSSGAVMVDDVDSTLYFLDDHEITYLEGEIDREYRQNLRVNVLKILFEVFQLQNNATVRGEILTIVDSFVPHLLAVGDFHSVTLIVQQLRQMHESAEGMSADHRKLLAMIPVRISNPTALGQLIQSLDDAAVQPTRDEISELFAELGPQVLDTILTWIPKLTNERVREVLRVVARGIANAHPAQAVNALKAQDVMVLLQTLEVVATLKAERLASEFGKLTRHENVEVRRRAVDALGAIGIRDARLHGIAACGDHFTLSVLLKTAVSRIRK